MNAKLSTALVIAAVLAVAGCSSTATPAPTTTTAPPGNLTVQQVATQVGCGATAPAETQIYTLDAATCYLGDKTLYIYTFSSDKLRDQWLTVARSFGGQYQVGAGWVVQTT